MRTDIRTIVLVVFALILAGLAHTGQTILIRRAGSFVGVAPIYNYDDIAVNTNITFWANFENCSPGTNCPQNGTEYALAATIEYSADADGCTITPAPDVNSPDIVTTGFPLIRGSTQGINVDGGSARVENVVCDNSGGTLTREVTAGQVTTKTISGCLLAVGATDTADAVSTLFSVASRISFHQDSTLAGRWIGVFTSTAPQTISAADGTVTTSQRVFEFSYLLRPTGDGNDEIRLYVDGTELASYTAGDLGSWDLTADSDLSMGTSSATVNHQIDMFVIRSCETTGCDCASNSLRDDIMGTCNNSATRCLLDADCGGGTCAP